MTISKIKFWLTQILQISSEEEFAMFSIQAFQHQYINNDIYRNFCNLLNKNPDNVISLESIPFLPIETWKNHFIKSFKDAPSHIFQSSGTTSKNKSRHYIRNISFYEESILSGFSHFFGHPTHYNIIGLIPDENKNESSLYFMMDFLIKQSENVFSGNFYNREKELHTILTKHPEEKYWILGTSYCLYNYAEKNTVHLPNSFVIETGGTKGFSIRNKPEPTKEEIFNELKNGFPVSKIASEYSMCELFSQAYMMDYPFFKTPPWMKVFIRNLANPMEYSEDGIRGGINIIDLANIDTCCFVATQDYGIKYNPSSFDVIGRIQGSDLRGCSML